MSRNYRLTHELLYTLNAGWPHAMEAAVGLLLLALPNLLVADLSVRFQLQSKPLYTGFTAFMLERLITMPYQGQITPPLETVKYFIDRTETTPEALNSVFQDALWLFYFLHIKSITARMVEEKAVFRWPLGAPVRPSLMTLELHSSCMRMDTLRQLLAATPNLKTLLYYHHCSFETELMVDGCCLLDCRILKKALEPLASSLEHLSLSMQYYIDDFHGNDFDGGGDNVTWGTSGTLGNMKNFTKLRYLKAPLIMLLGWSTPPPGQGLVDILPSALREFCSTDDLCGWSNVFVSDPHDVLQQTISLVKSRSGNLKRMILKTEQGHQLWMQFVRIGVRAACERNAVEYSTIECPWWSTPEVI